jgi:hypothetical protein
MSVIPEMITTVILIMVGLRTRNISQSYTRVATGGDRPVEQPFLLNSKFGNHGGVEEADVLDAR